MRTRRGNLGAISVRTIPKLVKGGGLTSVHIEEHNAREDAAFSGVERVEFYDEENDIPAFFQAMSALDQSRYLYNPPFLKPEEIRKKRFGRTPTDRWWEWEVRKRA